MARERRKERNIKRDIKALVIQETIDSIRPYIHSKINVCLLISSFIVQNKTPGNVNFNVNLMGKEGPERT